MPFAVLGDSDSHAYQDRLSFPEGGVARGGPDRAATLQWTEVLARLRGQEIDPGTWGEWGTRGRWARAMGLVGIERRSPRKQDFEFNYAWSGARCADLVDGAGRQAPRLASRIAEQPEPWRRGVVVIRIGINDLGTREALEAFARDGDSEGNRRVVDACLDAVDHAVRQLAEAQPELRFLLVGVLDNVDWPRNIERWADARERADIRAVLDRFDAGLRAITAASPKRAFFDDRTFYRALVGQRAADGRPAYGGVAVRDASGNLAWVTAFAEGDERNALFLADGHTGTVLNAHWAQAVVDALRSEFNLPIAPISDAERDAFLIRLYADDAAP
ncbi:MAG: GDSL-type esterase/lipase family protein [Silanimonas sp.]